MSLAKKGQPRVWSTAAQARVSQQFAGEGNPFYGCKHTAETRQKIAEAHRGSKASDETRAKMSAAHKARPHKKGYKASDETRRKLSLARLGNKHNLGRKDSPETRMRKSLAHDNVTPETRARISKGVRARWADPVWAHKCIKQIRRAQASKPNRPETILLHLLNLHFPGEWKYTGDGAVVIGRLNPDFVNVNGKKQVIEMFGNYWHKEDEEATRLETFRQYGFEGLVVWASELADLDELAVKLHRFAEPSTRASQSRASRGSNAPGKCRGYTRSTLRDKGDERVRSQGKP